MAGAGISGQEEISEHHRKVCNCVSHDNNTTTNIPLTLFMSNINCFFHAGLYASSVVLLQQKDAATKVNIRLLAAVI